MTINRTTLLDLPLPVTGTESGTWGDTTNNGLTQYMDIAIAGALSITGNVTLATTEGDALGTGIVSTTAQYRTLIVPASGPSANIVITAPSSNRTYHVINRNATYTVQVRAGANSGVTLGVNQSATVGYDSVAGDYVLVGPIGPTVPVSSGGTGATTLTGVLRGNGTSAISAGNVNLTSEVTGTLPVTNGGTGAATLTGVLRGNGTSAVTAGNVNLTSEVTGTLPVTNGGTGAATLTGVLRGNGTSAVTAGNVNLTSEVTGILPVANGGTGAATLTANNVLLGNGTSAVQFVAPGTAGNVLTSNGTTWSSTAPAAESAGGDLYLAGNFGGF